MPTSDDNPLEETMRELGLDVRADHQAPVNGPTVDRDIPRFSDADRTYTDTNGRPRRDLFGRTGNDDQVNPLRDDDTPPLLRQALGMGVDATPGRTYSFRNAILRTGPPDQLIGISNPQGADMGYARNLAQAAAQSGMANWQADLMARMADDIRDSMANLRVVISGSVEPPFRTLFDEIASTHDRHGWPKDFKLFPRIRVLEGEWRYTSYQVEEIVRELRNGIDEIRELAVDDALEIVKRRRRNVWMAITDTVGSWKATLEAVRDMGNDEAPDDDEPEPSSWITIPTV